MLKLSDKWAPVLVDQPETGMGYWITTIVLRDGRRFDRVVIVGGTVTSIGEETEIPFNEDQIADILVTHER